MLDLRHVRSLLAVIECGSFHEASRRLQCSQPTISQHVRKIEEALQAALVVRDRQHCHPTPEGEAFLPFARSLLNVAERARKAVSNRALTIGASSNIGIYLLQPHVKAFQANGGAGTEIDLWIGSNPDVADKLERHEIDVAVMEWWDDRPGFTATLWRREPLVVIVPPDHAWAPMRSVSKKLLLETPLIGGESGSGTGRALRQALGKAADGLQVSLQLGSTEAVKHAVMAGLGVSVVLEGAVVNEVRAGRLHALPLSEAKPGKELLVIERADQLPTAPASRFAEHLLQQEI